MAKLFLQKGIYRHYKGNYYDVIDVVRHSETLEYMALYRPLYGDFGLWVRPLHMFFEDVMVGEQCQSRFELIGNQSLKVYI